MRKNGNLIHKINKQAKKYYTFKKIVNLDQNNILKTSYVANCYLP